MPADSRPLGPGKSTQCQRPPCLLDSRARCALARVVAVFAVLIAFPAATCIFVGSAFSVIVSPVS